MTTENVSKIIKWKQSSSLEFLFPLVNQLFFSSVMWLCKKSKGHQVIVLAFYTGPEKTQLHVPVFIYVIPGYVLIKSWHPIPSYSKY